MPEFNQKMFADAGLDVSRETLDKFRTYAALLRKWQRVINLVSDETLDQMAERHFLDSAQLMKYLPNKNIRLADMGSGAGFPGMVLAMLGVQHVHLIESDVRKATFLREVSRETFRSGEAAKAPIIHDDRVEDTVIEGLDVITARALAPLKDLLGLANKLGAKSYLFLKGEKTEEELAKARKHWNFDLETYNSMTNKNGKILKINNLVKK